LFTPYVRDDSGSGVGPSIPPIKMISDAEYSKAPRLVKMQAKQAGLNEAIPRFDRFFLENGGASICEEKAIELAGKKMMLMGICHFGRIVMTSADGEKVYKPAGV